MLRQVLRRLPSVGAALQQQTQRQFGVSAVAAQKASGLDPIQQLFVDKIREYRTKSAGGKLVDATPETETMLSDMLGTLERSYQATGVDMTKFPTFNFTDPELVWPGLTEEQSSKMQEAIEAAEASSAADAAAAEAAEGEKYDPFEGLPRM